MSTKPPPPPKRSRSFEELRKQVEDLKKKNDELSKVSEAKEKPTPESISKKSPFRSAPKPSSTAIKLVNYSTDWIEQERANITVELNSDFEDPVIEPHAQILENDNLSLLGLSDQKQEIVVKTYKAFSVLNLAYRLLVTLPASYRLEAKSLIDALHADEIPKNSPVMCEMLSHIGKTSTNNYGNLRLLYPLQLAKKKIIKAMELLHDLPPFKNEFQYATAKPDWPVISKSWRSGIYIDKDTTDFLSAQGLRFINEQVDLYWEVIDNGEKTYFMLPDRFETHYHINGRYRPDTKFVSRWIRSIRFLKDIDEHLFWKIGCAMIAQIIDLRYIRSGNLTLYEWDSHFKDSVFKNLTWEDMSTYLGILNLETMITVENLANNYFIIVDYYRNIVEKHTNSVFKTVSVKKEEFGSEAQLMKCPNWKKDSNNAVDTSFKIDDKNKAVAAGVFNYTYNVNHNVSDRMYLKNSFRSIISNLISSFARK